MGSEEDVSIGEWVRWFKTSKKKEYTIRKTHVQILNCVSLSFLFSFLSLLAPLYLTTLTHYFIHSLVTHKLTFADSLPIPQFHFTSGNQLIKNYV